MGRIIKVRSGRSIPAQDMGAIFCMTKLAQPVKTAEAAEACKLLVDDLFWQNGDTGEFDIKPDITEYVESAGDWESHFNGGVGGDWEDFCGEPTWDGTKWITGSGWPFCAHIMINATGAWSSGFRPTGMRLELSQLTGEHEFIQLKDFGGHIIGEVFDSYSQLADIPLDFSGAGDIYLLTIQFASSCNGIRTCTKMEFFE